MIGIDFNSLRGYMVHKNRLRSGVLRKGNKAKYKVINWTSYNKILKKRGMISLYFPSSNIESTLVDLCPYKSGISGQSGTYLSAYIELLFTLYRLLGFGIRQIIGFVEDLWRSKELNIPVPSFGHLSDLFSNLSLKTKQFCNKLASKYNKGESIDLIVDSSGMRFNKASFKVMRLNIINLAIKDHGRSCILEWMKI